MSWFDFGRSERQREREHQQAMLAKVLATLETIQESATEQRLADSNALIAVAKGLVAQAESFAGWIDSFKTTQVPTTSIVREEDEYADEQVRNLERGLPADIAALPEEFQLAYALRNDPMLAGMND